MASAPFVRQHLLTEIERLPEDRLDNVLDFVGFLLSKKHTPLRNPIASQQARPAGKLAASAQPIPFGNDPLQALLSSLAPGAIAYQIGEDLHGE
jgi:hypothetical protein